MIQHEDLVRDQRLNWMLAAMGFLFVALAFAWADADSDALVVVISIVGMVSALSTGVGMAVSTKAIRRLRAVAEELPASGGVPVMSMTSSSLGDERWGRLVVWLYPWRVIPAVLTLAWASVPVLRLVE